VDAYPPLTVEIMRVLDECLDVASTPDFIVDASMVDHALAITPREHCGRGDEPPCDVSSPYFVCASKVARVAPRTASPCWRELGFVTLNPP
jgi:hypothetical protein